MNHAWEALGWTLIHFCWQAAAIVMVYWLVDLAAVKASIRVRYLISLIALLSMLVISLATLSYEAMERHSDLSLWTDHTTAADSLSFLPALNGVAAAPSKQPAHLEVNTLLPWLDLVWLLGVVSLSIRTVGGWWWLQRLRRAAFEEAPVAVRASFAQVCCRLGITGSVQLRISQIVTGPLAIGVFRSIVLLPASALLALSPEQLEVVLAHELAHVRRADYFWNLIQTTLETVFFFHPAVWWIGHRIRQQRELCCDDLALRCCADPVVYATALLRMEEERNHQLNLAMALGGHQSRYVLRARIARILGEAIPATRRARPLPLAILCAGVALLLLPLPHVFAGPGSHTHTGQTPSKLEAASPAANTVAGPAIIGPQEETPAAPDPLAQPDPQEQPGPLDPKSPQGEPSPNAQAQPAKPSPEVPSTPGTPFEAVTPSTQPAQFDQWKTLMQLDSMPKLPPTVTLPEVNLIDPMAAMQLKISELQQLVQSASSVPRIRLDTLQALSRMTALQKPAVDDSAELQDGPPAASSGKKDYIDRMRDAGYDVDIDKYMAMKIHGITPEYAGAMAKVGFGKPSADQLIAMKVQGVTPEYVAKLHAAGIDPSNFEEIISYRIFNVTPEFLEGMKAAGFASISPKDAVALRVQGVTPEYAKQVKHEFPSATIQELIQLRIFHIDDAFIASAKRHGLEPLTVQKLVRLRISGVLDDNDSSAEQHAEKK